MFGINKTFAKFKTLASIKTELSLARQQADHDLQNLLERNEESTHRNEEKILMYQSMNDHLAAESDEAQELKKLVEGAGEDSED